MRFVSVRELRTRSAEVWRRLKDERDMVVTSNGKPVAILSGVSQENLEESLSAMRRARAIAAVQAMQRISVETGASRMTKAEIQDEIDAARKGRPK